MFHAEFDIEVSSKSQSGFRLSSSPKVFQEGFTFSDQVSAKVFKGFKQISTISTYLEGKLQFYSNILNSFLKYSKYEMQKL